MTYLETIDRWTAKPQGPRKYLTDLLSRIAVTQENLADAIGTSRFSVNQIVDGKCSFEFDARNIEDHDTQS